MSRKPFGWDLPPGVTQRHIDEAAGSGDLPECSICQRSYYGHGNNAWPVNEGRCCDECNHVVVLPARVHSPPGYFGTYAEWLEQQQQLADQQHAASKKQEP